MINRWRVHKTVCWPREWKVNTSTDPYAGDNNWLNFFLTETEAQLEAEGRCPCQDKA